MTQCQQTVFAKLLWLTVSTIIILHYPQRQISSKNEEFCDLLMCLQEGRCTAHDYDLLNSCVMSSESNIDFISKPWQHTPVIVYDNAAKDAINAQAASAFTKELGQELHWYYAEDRHQKIVVKEKDLKDYLACLPSGQTQQRLGQIPLAIGMPVLISQNFNVKGGIVNGSQGTVSHICYCIDDDGRCHLTSVIVHIEDSSDIRLGNLPSHDLPILTNSTDIKFKHPFTKKRCTIQRIQVPILPAFAMTAH